MYQDKAAIGYAFAVRGSRHTSKLSQLDRLTPAFQERGKQQAVSRCTNGLIPLSVKGCLSAFAPSVMPLDSQINADKRSALSFCFKRSKRAPALARLTADGAKLANHYFSIFGARNGTIRPSLCCSINPKPNGNSSRLITIELGSKSLNKYRQSLALGLLESTTRRPIESRAVDEITVLASMD